MYQMANGIRTYTDGLDGLEEVFDGAGDGDGHLGLR
jgi:hypothetical protein